MNKIRKHLIREFTEVSPTRGFTTILGLTLLTWGLWVMNPYVDTFESPFYSVMKEAAVEPVWATLFIIAGASLLVGVIFQNVSSVARGSFMGFFLWLALSIMYFLGDYTVSVWITNFWIAMMHAWLYLQVQFHPQTIVGHRVNPEGFETYRQAVERRDAQGLDTP